MAKNIFVFTVITVEGKFTELESTGLGFSNIQFPYELELFVDGNIS